MVLHEPVGADQGGYEKIGLNIALASVTNKNSGTGFRKEARFLLANEAVGETILTAPEPGEPPDPWRPAEKDVGIVLSFYAIR